jgi:hypothetical protein
MVRNQLFLMQDHILEKINNQMGDKVVSRLVFR